MKNAIFTLVFGNENYITGVILSAYIHKKFIKSINLDIDLVIMVDDKIYEYKNELLKYFDIVKKIDLLELKLSEKFIYYFKKYSKFMKYLINKWQILQFEEYNKILFLDSDFLPIKKDFYKIFNLNTPALFPNISNTYICNNNIIPTNYLMKKHDIEKIKKYKAEQYYNVSLKLNFSIDATIGLFTPKKKLYNEYLDFINKASINGYISSECSAVDETSLLLFFAFYKNIQVYCIDKEYCLSPWYHKDYNLNKVSGINYISLIKPWLKFPFLQWPEEIIWHKIANHAMKKSKIIKNIYINGLLQNLKLLITYDIQTNIKKNKYFIELQKILENNTNITYENKIIVKQIIKLNKKICYNLNNKSIIDYTNINNLL